MPKKKQSAKRATSRKQAEPKKTVKTSKQETPRKAAATTTSKSKKPTKVGEIWRGETKYIDPEPKKQRNFVVVIDDGKRQSVSKLKSIKVFDENGKNADEALIEINATRYGLEKRTGVDFETFDTNRMSGKPLRVSDKDVFPESAPRAKLGSHDTARVIRHSGKKKKKRDK